MRAEQSPPATRYDEGIGANQSVADPAGRRAVSFDSDDDRIAEHLYRPLGAAEDERTAGIVVTGPISSGKEQAVPLYAARLAAAGYTVLTSVVPSSARPTSRSPRSRQRW